MRVVLRDLRLLGTQSSLGVYLTRAFSGSEAAFTFAGQGVLRLRNPLPQAWCFTARVGFACLCCASSVIKSVPWNCMAKGYRPGGSQVRAGRGPGKR